jgi:hypothetical protein
MKVERLPTSIIETTKRTRTKRMALVLVMGSIIKAPELAF